MSDEKKTIEELSKDLNKPTYVYTCDKCKNCFKSENSTPTTICTMCNDLARRIG